MSTGFGQPRFGSGFGLSNRQEGFPSFSQPTSTSSISKRKHHTTEIEESKAIAASLMKIEQIIAEWRRNLNRFGITEDLETEKNIY